MQRFWQNTAGRLGCSSEQRRPFPCKRKRNDPLIVRLVASDYQARLHQLIHEVAGARLMHRQDGSEVIDSQAPRRTDFPQRPQMGTVYAALMLHPLEMPLHGIDDHSELHKNIERGRLSHLGGHGCFATDHVSSWLSTTRAGRTKWR